MAKLADISEKSVRSDGSEACARADFEPKAALVLRSASVRLMPFTAPSLSSTLAVPASDFFMAPTVGPDAATSSATSPLPSRASRPMRSFTSGPMATPDSFSFTATRLPLAMSDSAPCSVPSYSLAECGARSARPFAARSSAFSSAILRSISFSAPTASLPSARNPSSPLRSTGTSTSTLGPAEEGLGLASDWATR